MIDIQFLIILIRSKIKGNEWIAWERKSHHLLNFQHILKDTDRSKVYLAFKRKVFQYMLHSLWKKSILIKGCHSSCLIIIKRIDKEQTLEKSFLSFPMDKRYLAVFLVCHVAEEEDTPLKIVSWRSKKSPKLWKNT